MTDLVLGVLAVLAGSVFCFRGYLTMRVVIPIWGVFAGFSVGAGAIAAITDEGVLSSAAGWIVGVVVGLVFGALAYLYFEVSIVLGMSAIGFVLGSSLMVALNVTWTWVIVAVGVVVGAGLAAISIVGELPMLLLTVLTAFSGSTVMVAGMMLFVGKLNTADLSEADVVSRIQDGAGWWVLYVVLAFAGILAQFRSLESIRGSVRAEWARQRGEVMEVG